MNEVILSPKEQPEVPIEAKTINPDFFAGKTLEEIKKLHIWYGNTDAVIGDFFEVKGESGETSAKTKIIIDGDVNNTKRIGQGMTDGEIIINGGTKMYVGVEMKGGRITVHGDVDSWSGQNMSGGELNIYGNAGDYVGSAYRGDWRGMSGGSITIHGNVGNEIAEFMLGGKMLIKGNVNIMPGIHINGGLLIIEGNVVARVGAEMKSGTIVVKGIIEEFLPSFEYLGVEEDINPEGKLIKESFHKFTGDFASKGSEGIVYVAVHGNKHILPK